MQPGAVPNFVSDFHSFTEATQTSLDEEPSETFAGVSKDGHICWVVKGAHLEVIDISTRNRLAAWRFGKVLKDEHTSVTCVKEFEHGKTCKLLVGVCNASPSGLLCLFDVAAAKVVKAIEIPQQVTEVEMVCPWVHDNTPRWALSEHLCYFCGLVAVGTNSGHVFLVDMCMDDNDFYSDEEYPAKLHFISPRIRDTENQRFHCMSQGLHLGIQLNEECFNQNGFQYLKPDGIVMKTFRPDVVSVTCLKYIQQAGVLVIGFSFGCFQLWKLHVPVLEYSSRLENNPLPVTHIAYQEPENDPKNFCYLWIARGQLLSDDEQKFDSTSTVCLYQLSFNKKIFYNNYGVFYEDLTSVCLRLDYELGSSPNMKSDGSGCSKLVGCYTLVDPHYQAPSRLEEDESFEESVHGPDLSLCVFAWEATAGNTSVKISRHLAIFDINRWYHSQMPSTVRFSGAVDTCAYLSFHHLDEAAEKAHSDSLLMLHVNADSIRKFISNSPMPAEQHFYPSSLAFDTNLIFETGIVQAQFLGSQRQILSNIEANGPAILLHPQDLYSLCIYMGLLPRPIDIASSNPNMVYQRESILTLALEYNMLGFLRNCITQWAGGEYEHQGCTLKFLLDWGWERVSKTKHQIDSLCVHLYDWSALSLDQRAIQSLQQTSQRLNHLVSLFRAFASLTGPITDQGQMDLTSKQLVTSLISHHLSVVLWFVETGLLPENDEAEELINQYSYPAGSLIQTYKNRRAEIQDIHSDIGETSLLMIDGLVEHMGVHDLWEREGGSGLYPPLSLHALLSTYLLENVDILSKHCLVLYILLDLVSVDNTDSSEQFSEKVSGFTRRFNIPCTLVKLIQGFWLLDHRDFEEALVLLLDPLVIAEYSQWQHLRLIKSLLYQGDSKMALRYLDSVKPALATQEEVKLKLTVLLANGLVAEALEYQRICRDQTNIADLMSHVFLGCQQTKTIDRLLQLPLTPKEEQLLVSYLLESSEPHSQEILVMHYLQKARFTEAIQLNDKLKHAMLSEPNSLARERAASRNAIVDSYMAILPSVQRKLMFEHVHFPKKNVTWRREVCRPTPLSTKVTKSKSKVISQSTLIMEIMEKLDEIEADERPSPEMDANRSVGAFICTPVTPARQSQRETPATVYPESVDKDKTGLNQSLNMSLGTTYTAFLRADTPTSTDRRTSKFFSASCLTLLQTPPVHKMTPKKQRLSSANVLTPQSILKVRHLISTTSPSPSSTNVTPGSGELDTSARKVPRKLGYGAASQPSTPRSVSFHEPPLSSLPRHLAGEVSQPASPKSVSFADESKTPGTPKELRFADLTRPSKKSLEIPVRSVRDRSPTPESPEKSPKLVGRVDQLHRPGLHTTPVADQQDENISDEEVEEMEASYDTTTSPGADTSITSTSTVRSTGLHISVSPQSISPPRTSPRRMSPSSPFKPRISGSPLVKIPGSPTVKISKSAVSSYAGSGTEHAQTVSQISSEKSPVLQVKDSEPVDLTESDDNMETDADVSVSNVDADVSSSETENKEEEPPQLELEVTGYKEIFHKDEEINPNEILEEISPDDIEEGEIEEMDVVSSSTEVGRVQQMTEAVWEAETFMKTEQVKNYPEPPVLEGQRTPSPKATADKVPYKVTARKSLTPPSERNLTLEHPPASIKISPKTTPQPSPKQSPHPSPKRSPKLSRQLNVSSKLEPVSGLFEAVPKAEQPPELTREEMESEVATEADVGVPVTEPLVIKTSPKSSPASSTRSSPKLSPTVVQVSPEINKTDEILQEIDAKFADTPAAAVSQKTRPRTLRSETGADSTDASKPTKETRKYEIPVIKQEIEEYVPEQAPATPTRTRQRGRESLAEVMTPTRSSRRLKEKEENQQVEPQTPTRSTRRGKKDENAAATPTRVRGKKVKEELENVEQIKAETPKPFSRRAKEVVQESLQQLAEDMEIMHEIEPETPLKLEKEVQMSPKSVSKKAKEKVQESLDQLDDKVKDQKHKAKATPKKCKGKRIDQMDIEDESPFPANQKEEDALHETVAKLTEEMLDTIWEREQKSPDDSSPSRLTRIKARDKGSMSPGPSRLDRSIQVTVTPTRSSRRLAEKENMKENEESLAKTPTRGRRGRKTIDTAQSPAVERKFTDKLITPFRGRRKKDENVENVTDLPVIQESKSPSRRKTVPPTRSPVKNESENKDIVETAQTPTRGRRKKKDDTMNETSEVSLIETGALTPTRRSSRLRKESIDGTELTPSRRQSFSQADINFDSEFMDTGSDGPRTHRRSFGRADNVQNIRRQNFSKSQQSKDEILNADSFEGHSTRRHTIGVSGFKIDSEKLSSDLDKRTSRKISTVREQTEVGTPATTPSRRGRPRRKDVSPITESTEEGNENEVKPDKGTPSRKGRGRKVKEVKEELKPDIDKTGENINDDDDKEMVSEIKEAKEKVESETAEEVEEPKPKSTPSRSKRQKMEKREGLPESPEKEIISQSFAALVEAVDFVPSSPFRFADPMQLGSEEVAPPKPFTPTKSFIFSPPISRGHKPMKEKSPEKEGILLPPGPPEVKPVPDKSPTRSSKRVKRRTKKLYSEDEILLISPVSFPSDSGEEGRSLLTRETRQSSRQAELKKDGTKVLVRSLNALQRPVRTKHRFGPVGRKKKKTEN